MRRSSALTLPLIAATMLVLVASSSAAPMDQMQAPPLSMGAVDELRAYAFGYKHRVADADSYQAYDDHLRSLVNAADPHPEDDDDPRPKLFVFPEDSALYAMFMGRRGLPFRALEPVLRTLDGNGGSVAVAGLIAVYQPQAAYYRLKFPAQNLSQARLGLLAITDTLYRSFFETFRGIAIAHHAWVVASANIAPAHLTTDPVVATLLADPEARDRPCAGVAPPCAYEAASENVYNQAFVFRPDGSLVFNPSEAAREGELDGAVKKTYPVPIEQGPVEQGKIGLDLSYGSLRQVRPVEIAGRSVGIVISKPAWMIDELDRLEIYNTEVLLQPEAFSSWGVPIDDWSPDVLKQSGWTQIQKRSSFRAGVLPVLTGNFFDLVFDGQSHIVAKATEKAAGPARYVGQPNDVGWVGVTPWVVGDGQGQECDGGDLAARRACLAAVGAALAPGSGDQIENGYAEGSVSAMVGFGPPHSDATRTSGILGANIRVDDGPAGTRQRNPQVATGPSGERIVAWQDDREGVDQIRLARVGIDGVIGPSRPVTPAPGVRQVRPRVSIGVDGAIHVVWQELDPAPRLRYASTPDWDSPFGDARAIGSALAADEQWVPSLSLDDAGRVHLAWIALVDGSERLAYTRLAPSTSGGIDEASRLLDAEAFPAPEPLAERLNNRWSPSIAARGSDVAVVWTDFRNYSWDLFAAVSHDGGDHFGEHLRVDDAGRLGGASAALERLHEDPSIDLAADGTVHVAWADLAGRRSGCASCPQQRRPDADIAYATLSPQDAGFSSNARVDDTGDGLLTQDRVGFSSQWRPALATDPIGGRLVAVWQDLREGNNDIYLASSSNGGTTWGPNQRVDDTGTGMSNQFRPDIAVGVDGSSIIVWQDDRGGSDDIYMAAGWL